MNDLNECREAFIKYFFDSSWPEGRPDKSDFWNAWEAAWNSRAEKNAPTFVVPDGWQLVPIEPTDGMISNAVGSVDCTDSYYPHSVFDESDAKEAWKAMLAAATHPQAQTSLKNFSMSDNIKNKEDAREYIKQVVQYGDLPEFLRALDHIAKAKEKWK